MRDCTFEDAPLAPSFRDAPSGAGPGIHTHDGGYGFRARDFVASRNDGNGVLRRADPIAVETVRHAMAEMHQRDGTCFDVLRVEHREIAAILLRAPDRREQPAIALG